MWDRFSSSLLPVLNDGTGNKKHDKRICNQYKPKYPVLIPRNQGAKNKKEERKELQLHNLGDDSHTQHPYFPIQSWLSPAYAGNQPFCKSLQSHRPNFKCLVESRASMSCSQANSGAFNMHEWYPVHKLLKSISGGKHACIRLSLGKR